MNAIGTQRPPSIPIRREWIDGQCGISIRPIERADGSALSDFYAGLSPESRRRRFLGGGGQPADLPSRLLDQGADGLVATLAEAGPNDGLVVGHASLQPDGVGGAEIAFAVADGLQGHGIGRRLVDGIITRARARGLERVTAVLLADNAPMRRLLRTAGCLVIADDLDAGVEQISLALDPAA